MASTASFRFYPRSGWTSRMTGGKFQGGNDGTFTTWTDLATIATQPTDGVWTVINVSADLTTYRYIRYLSPTNGWGNVAELEFYDGTYGSGGTKFPAITIISGTTGGSNPPANAFDNNTGNYYEGSSANGQWVGLDTNVPAGGWARLFPRSGNEGRMAGAKLQGSNDYTMGTLTSGTWTDLYTISGTPPAGWNTLTLTGDPRSYRYLRYYGGTNDWGNVCELEFYYGQNKLTYTATFGTSGSFGGGGNTYDKALDGNTSTYFDSASSSNNIIGIDQGSSITTKNQTGKANITTGTTTRNQIGVARIVLKPTDIPAWYPNGAAPSLTQSQRMTMLSNAWTQFKTYTLTSTGMPVGMPAGAYRIKVPDQTDSNGNANFTNSEGIGYGMIGAVFMGDPNISIYDSNAKTYFDGLWTYYNYYKNASGLMNWRVDYLGNVIGNNGATDGDVDVAFALVMAHRIWGSTGTIDYGAQATTLINAIRDNEFYSATHTTTSIRNVMMNGDAWDSSRTGSPDWYMPDYFAPAWYYEFYHHTGDSRWLDIIAANWTPARGVFSSNGKGLVPDNSKRDGTAVSGQSYIFGYNAIRIFRTAADYLWNGGYANTLAYSMHKNLADFTNTNSSGTASAAKAEWDLTGTTNGGYTSPTFSQAYMVSSLVDSSTSTWAASLASWLDSNNTNSYFGNSLVLMAMLLASGYMQPNRVLTSTTTTKNQTGISRLTNTTSQLQTGKARLTTTTTQNQVGISRLTNATTRNQTGITRITSTTPKTQVGISRVTTTTTRNQTGISRITATTTKDQIGVSRVALVTLKNQVGLSRLTITSTKNQTGVANILSSLATTTRDQLGKAAVLNTATRDQVGISRIAYTTLKTQVGVSRIQLVTPQAILGISRLAQTTLQTVTGTARIGSGVVRNQTGVSRITQVVAQAITGVSNVGTAANRTQTGTSRIQQTVTRDQVGVSRVGIITTRDQAGVARVGIGVNRTQIGISRMSGVVNRLQTGIAHVIGSVTRDQSGKAAIFGARTQTITGIARIVTGYVVNQPSEVLQYTPLYGTTGTWTALTDGSPGAWVAEAPL